MDFPGIIKCELCGLVSKYLFGVGCLARRKTNYILLKYYFSPFPVLVHTY